MDNPFYENIGSLAPVNRLALWNSGPNVDNDDYNLESKTDEPCLDAPPDMRAIDSAMRASGSFVDFTGIKVGRLTVLGILHPRFKQGRPVKGGASPGRWVCRCDCGKYTWRRTKVLKSFLEMTPEQADVAALCKNCNLARKRLEPEYYQRRKQT